MITPEFNLDMDALLAFHRSHFGDARMEGEALAPEAPEAPAGDPAPEVFDYPANTPLADMTAEQQVEYWREKAQKHEKRASKFKDLTPEALAELREKAEAHDALQHELMSDHDKALDEARNATRAEVAAEYLPQLVAAKFEAVSAGRLSDESLGKILAPLDLSKFVTDGKVDTAKVSEFINEVAPAGLDPRAQRGPSSFGLGNTPPAPHEPGSQGREQAAKRFGDRANPV